MVDCCVWPGGSWDPASSFTIEQVRAPEFYHDCSLTVEYWALFGVEPVLMERTLKIVNELYALDRNYLRRINKGVLLLWPVENEATNILLFTRLKLKNLFTDNLSVAVVNVPKFCIYTKTQYEVAKKVWPIRITNPLVDEPDCTSSEITQWTEILHELMNDDTAGCVFQPVSESSNIMQGMFGIGDGGRIGHAVFDACKKVGKMSDYLATGYLVVCKSEPCVMCAMALLHSRVATVVFPHKRGSNTPFGGLGSLCNIHTERNLNHKFNVFRIVVD